ncbi:hypothetical protein SAMN05660816_00865 [Niastella yeongjuensis]|nr:hypothetical protein SAMN05660816_00865 [Niastella yeongjuensis]
MNLFYDELVSTELQVDVGSDSSIVYVMGLGTVKQELLNS